MCVCGLCVCVCVCVCVDCVCVCECVSVCVCVCVMGVMCEKAHKWGEVKTSNQHTHCTQRNKN